MIKGVELASVKKIAVIKLSSLGDILMMLPFLFYLKKMVPGAEITLLTQKECVPLVEGCPAIARIIAFDKKVPTHGFWQLCKRIRKTQEQLSEEVFDIAIDLQGLFKSWLFIRKVKAAVKIGKGYFPGLDLVLPHNRSLVRHAVPGYFEVCEALGVPLPIFSEMRFPLWYLGKRKIKKKSVLFAPFTRWRTKQWPVENWIALGNLMIKRGHALFVSGAPQDAVGAQEICVAIPGAVNMAGELTLREFICFVDSMEQVVVLDSLSMHIAAALGKEGVALFGPTDPRRTGPWGGSLSVLQGDCPKLPCLKKFCLRGRRCMSSMTVDSVAEALRIVD